MSSSFKPGLVIAIDIGSYASGYVMQWMSDYEKDPLHISVNSNWGDAKYIKRKTLTALLLKPDKTVAAFGYNAVDKWSDLEDDKWFFFQGFKMSLYSKTKQIAFDPTIEDYNGRHLPAVLIFGKVIQFFKDHALGHLITKGLITQKFECEDETKWVITIPAIWSDTAKSIIREAARQANIKDTHLTIALEPECAAIYCRALPRDKLTIRSNDGQIYVCEPGSTVMVVDMGGGTVDITTMKVNADGSLAHIHMTGGGPWGGMRVNENILTMLKGLVGHDEFGSFATEHRMDYCDLLEDVEDIKRQVTSRHNTDPRPQIRLQLIGPLASFDKQSGKNLRKHKVLFKNSRLYIPMETMWEYFDPVVQEMLDFINENIKQVEVTNSVTAILLVGGFSNSSYVIEGLRHGLDNPNIPVIRPEDTELAVLKGAAMFGHNKEIITSRIMPRTYGVACTMQFDKARHNPDLQLQSEDGKTWATSVFRKHVTIGQSVKCGEWIVAKDYYPEDADQTVATIYVFASDKADPNHTIDEGCAFIGQFDIEFPTCHEQRCDRTVAVTMRFGGTEIEVKAENKKTGNTYYKYLKM